MKTIYRVEDENGIGCYACNFPELADMYEQHALNFINYPRPHDDKGIDRKPEANEICGFKDYWQAVCWFTKEDFKILKRYGFKLKKVLVEKITAYGEFQVLAIRG